MTDKPHNNDIQAFECARTLIDLCCIPCTDNRLRAVLSAHPVNQSSTKSKRLKLLTKVKNRVVEQNPSALHRSNEILSALEEPNSDRVLTVLGYLIDNSTQSNPPITPASVRTATLLNRASLVANNVAFGGPNDQQPAQSLHQAVPSDKFARSLTPAFNATTSFGQTSSVPHSHLFGTLQESSTTATEILPQTHSDLSFISNPHNKPASTYTTRTTSPHGTQIASSGANTFSVLGGSEHHRTMQNISSSVSDIYRSVPREHHPQSVGLNLDGPDRNIKPLSGLNVHNDDDATDLCFGDAVTVQSAQLIKRFLATEQESLPNENTACKLYMGSLMPFSFVLRNAKNLTDRSPVRYLDIVMISTESHPNSFLQLSHSNDLILVDYQSSNTNQLHTAKFTVYAGRPVHDEILAAGGRSGSVSVSHSFLSVKSKIKNGDDIILKSSTGLYVTVDERDMSHSDTRAQTNQDLSRFALQATERVSGLSQVFVVNRARLPVMDNDLKKICGLLPIDTSMSASHSKSLYSQNQMPSDVSEGALVEDMLFCLLGLDGEFVRRVVSSTGITEWRCDDRVLDVSHRTLLNDRLLPLANDYSFIQHYSTVHCRHEFGTVHHALNRAVVSIMEEYHSMIAQLDLLSRESLTLTRLAYHLSSVQRTLRHLVMITQSTGQVLGGAVIDTLHRQFTQAGESNHRALLLHLLQAASAPFFDMLSTWLYLGTFCDQYMEFCVVIDKSMNQSQLLDDFNATYWSSRWQFRHDRCPSFLRQHQDRILATGKYWNVLRQCSQASARARGVTNQQNVSGAIRATAKQSQSAASMLTVGVATIPAISYSENDGLIISLIDLAYARASRSLIHLLLQDYSLIEHFTLMKHIYLLGAGDWLVHFMDAAWSELSAPAHTINRSKLQSLLDLSFSSSTAITSLSRALGQSAEGESVTVALQPHRFDTKLNAIYHASESQSNGIADNSFEPPSLIDMRPLTGLDTLTLNYHVDYPLSLILSKTSLTKYQLCFKLLIQLKFMERECSQIFMEQKGSKSIRWYSKHERNDEQKQFVNVGIVNHMFRHQILSFLRNILYYFTAEVIEPEFQVFVTKIETAANFDTVLNDHLSFLDSICSKLLLTDMVLLNALLKIVYFVQNYFILMRQKSLENDSVNGSNDNDCITSMCCFDIEQVEMFQAEFHDLMCSFMQVLSEKNQTMTYALIQRLDYNGWYQAAEERYRQMPSMHHIIDE